MIDIQELKDIFLNLQNSNQNLSHIYLDGAEKLFLSAPHAVNQSRNNKIKNSEFETALVCIYLNKYHNIPCLIKLNHQNDDANFDISCPYKNDLEKILTEKNPKLFVDLHEMKFDRLQDVCLGTGDEKDTNLLNLANDINKIIDCFDCYKVVSVNNPFAASTLGTNAKFVSSKLNIPSVQIEVSSRHIWDFRGASNEDFETFINCLLKLNQFVKTL